DGLRHTPAARMQDRPVAVAGEVVADVVPAVPLDVGDHDRAHDRRRLGRRVAVRAGGVVDDREGDAVSITWRRPADRLRRVPPRARDDLRLPGDLWLPDGPRSSA